MSGGRSKSVLGSTGASIISGGAPSGTARRPSIISSSKPSSPKPEDYPVRRASSGLGGSTTPSRSGRQEESGDEEEHDLPSAMQGGAGRPQSGSGSTSGRNSSAIVNRGSSGLSSAGGGPVKGLYRPPNATPNAAAAGRAIEPISVHTFHSNNPPIHSAPVQSSPNPLSSRPQPIRRRIRPTPEDSDYDSDEVVSEEETEEETPIVHPQPEPLNFQLTVPQWDQLEGDEVLDTIQPEYPSDIRLSLSQPHLTPAGAQLHPHTSVEIEHQIQPLAEGAMKIPANLRPEGGRFNNMSFSSTEAPSHGNDLLSTDTHPPYTHQRHARPLTIWLIGKPLAGKRTLARKLQKELGNTGQGSAHKRDYTNSIAHLTPEFLLAHAKEASLSAGGSKFPEIDGILGNLSEGRLLDPTSLLKLFVFALHSDRIAYHGYILGDLPFPATELQHISSTYPALVEKGVWPPQYVIDLDLSNEEVLNRLQHRKKIWLTKRLSDCMGFKEPREEVEGDGGNDATLSRPVSSASSRNKDDGSEYGGVGRFTQDGEELPYTGWTALHRPNDSDELDEDEYLSRHSLTVNQSQLLLESEVNIQMDLVSYESTRAVLAKLLSSWSQFHPVGSRRTLSSKQSFHRLNASHPVANLLAQILYLLGQNKWTRYSLAQHLPFIGKEELKPIEEDEIRELFILKHLNNSNPKVKDGSLINLANIPLPTTSDPTGLDLETEALYDTIHHQFGIYQTFCPVTLLNEGRLVEGNEDFTCSYQGHVYLLATAPAMKLFQENPRKYTLENPPTLPRNFVISIIGGPSVGKTALAESFATKYGWKVIPMDGTEAGITKAVNLTSQGGQWILDNGPSTVPLIEFAITAGLRMDKIVYLYVDDVEQLPPRLRAAKKAKAELESASLTDDERKALAQAEAEAAAAAAAAAALKDEKSSKKKKGASKDAKNATAAAATEGNDDDPTPDEEDLMDRVEEFQHEWTTAVLPYLEEHMVPCTEVNNSNPPPAPTSSTDPSTAAPSTAASAAVSGTVSPAFNGHLGATGTATISTAQQTVAQGQKAIAAVFETARQLIDPFYLYRSLTTARRLTPDLLDRSKDEDRLPRAPENRSLRFGETNFCPVCLIKNSLLIAGLPNEGIAVGPHSYSCCSRRCSDEFLAHPAHYNLYSKDSLNHLRPNMPALRILLTGAKASGKSHAAEILKNQYGLHHSFSLSSFFYPALRSLAQKTLDLVLATQKANAEKKAIKEQRRLARRQARRAKRLAERQAAREAADEKSGSEEEEEGSGAETGAPSSDEDDESEQDDIEDQDLEEEEEPELLEERKDVLKDFLVTPTDTLEFPDILALLLEAELFTSEQLENILRDIFTKHSWIDANTPFYGTHRPMNNVAGWVCEVDLTSPILLARLEALLKDTTLPENRPIKPHVILPVDCSAEVATQRLVVRETERRQRALLAGTSSELSGDLEVAAERLRKREAHRLKVEAEKARIEAEQKAAREKAEAEEKAKAAKSKPRYGPNGKKLTLKERRELEAKEKAEAEAAAAEAAAAAAASKGGKKKAHQRAPSMAPEEKKDDEKSVDENNSPRAADATDAAAAPVADENNPASDEPKEKTAAELAAEEELERLTAQCADLHKTSLEAYEVFIGNLKAVQSFIILEGVSGSADVESQEAYQTKLFGVFKAFLQAQASLFITPIEITEGDSNKLLRNGMKSLRSFGTYCPCCLLPRAIEHPVAYDCKLSTTNVGGPAYFPVVWSNNIVLTCSPQHRAEFISDPRRYLLAAPPKPILSQTIVVLESADPTASTKLAKKLCEELKLVYLTMDQILTTVSKLPTVLGQKIAAAVDDGLFLSNTLLVSALEYAVTERVTLQHGYVLDGFPTTVAQARLMKRVGIVPAEIVSLNSGPQPTEIDNTQRNQLLASLISSADDEPADGSDPPPPDSLAPRRLKGVSSLVPRGLDLAASVQSQQLIDHTLESEQVGLEKFYELNYHNLLRIYVGSGPYGSSNEAQQLKSLKQQSEYVLRIFQHHSHLRQSYFLSTHSTTFAAGRPARVAHLGFTRGEIIKHSSTFKDYCPCCYILQQGLLNRSTDVKANQWTVEFKQEFYRLCSRAHQDIFLSTPERFSSATGIKLPNELPFQVIRSDAVKIDAKQCQLSGYCPVTLHQSTIQGSLRVEFGRPEFTASYLGKVYRLLDSAALTIFLGSPQFYSTITLPQKMPPAPQSIVKQSPESLLKLGKTLAFMELTFQQLLMKGLNSFETLPGLNGRLKFPSLPLNSSALIYLALYLKTHNPKNPTWLSEKYQKKLDLFVSHCQLIPIVAGHYRTSVDSAVNKPLEETKEQDSPIVASPITPTSSTAPLDSKLKAQFEEYDSLRAEMRAHADGVGSRKSLAQFFEKYIR